MCLALASLFDGVASWCVELIKDVDEAPPPVAELQATPDPQPLSPIYCLNDDVLYYLATSALSTEDRAAFVLTCRSIFQAVGGKRVLQELKERPVVCRAQFLERLDVDFPDRVLCYWCATFHSRYQIEADFEGGDGTECDFRSGYIYYGPHRYLLHYRQAKEIVNRLSFGPSYGRNLEEVMLPGPFFKSMPEDEITGTYHHDLKWVKKNGTFALIIKRSVRLEYEYTSERSRTSAEWKVSAGSSHLALYQEEYDMIEEKPPVCFKCGHCGAERIFSITRLPHKPGFAVYRSTLWESVALCKNSGYDLWDHICAPYKIKARCIPVSLRDLEHHYAFHDDIPSVSAHEFDDFSLRKPPS